MQKINCLGMNISNYICIHLFYFLIKKCFLCFSAFIPSEQFAIAFGHIENPVHAKTNLTSMICTYADICISVKDNAISKRG